MGFMLATGALAAGVGLLAPTAAKRFVLGEVKHDWLAGQLDLDQIDADGRTVLTKSGPVFRVLHIRGVTYDAKVEAEQERLLKVRASALHAVGEGRCSVWLYGVKRQKDISFSASWPSPALTEIGLAEQRRFTSSFYVNWYMVISGASTGSVAQTAAKITAMLSDFKCETLSKPEDPEKPCPLSGFINYLVSGDHRSDLPALSSNLSGSLPGADLHLDRTTGLISTMTPTKQLHRIIGIQLWPEVVNGRYISEVLAIPGDIEVVQACLPWDRDIAVALYKRRQMEANAAFIGNPTLAEECEAIIQLLTQGQTTLFHAWMQFILRADSEAKLDALTRSVSDILGKRRILYSVETVGVGVGWFGRFPGRSTKKLLRPLNLGDRNIAALWCWPNEPAGMDSSPFGEMPVRHFATPTGQAYAFQFHVSAKPQAKGNYLVFAPTGGGKSTLMMHLLGGLAKFDGVRSYIFDSKDGAKFMTEVMGGVYQSYDTLALNPLDVGEDTPQARHRVLGILRAMAAGVEASEDDDEVFAHVVELVFQLDPPERTLNAIYDYAFGTRTSLKKAFARWVTDEKGRAGSYAHVFNSPHDSLGSFLADHFMVGINMNEALDDPILGPPIVAHISAAISRSAASAAKGFAIFIDEAAKLLQNDGFKHLAAEMYREYRKLNGCVGLAFQDPAALFRSGMAPAFLENTATLIFLPNSQATRSSLEPFNLNDEQMGFIMNGPEHPEQRQVLIVKRDAAAGLDESAIVDIDLAPILGPSMRFYRAGIDANRDLAKAKKEWGNQWLEHV